MRRIGTLVFTAGLALAAPAVAQDGLFNYGNIVVAQLGDGGAALSGAAAQVTLREFQVGPNIFTGDNLAFNSGASGRRVTSSGTATSEGFLTLSTNAQYLSYQGYDAALATAAVAATTAAATNRVVARVGFDMSVDTTTALTDAYSAANIRSSLIDGANIYTAGTATSPGGGVRSTTLGGTTSTNLSGALQNARVVNMSGSALLVSASSGSNVGISVVSGGVASLILGTGTGSSPYDFLFAAGGVVYIADDRSVASGGGLQKWVPSGGGGYTLAYTLSTGLGTVGLRGLAMDFATGVMYATSAETTANKLVTIVDTGAASSFTVLATATSNTIFRGVEFAPVPTPGSFALMGIAGLAIARRRRR